MIKKICLSLMVLGWCSCFPAGIIGLSIESSVPTITFFTIGMVGAIGFGLTIIWGKGS